MPYGGRHLENASAVRLDAYRRRRRIPIEGTQDLGGCVVPGVDRLSEDPVLPTTVRGRASLPARDVCHQSASRVHPFDDSVTVDV
jgi:hypothetical protein